MNGWDSRIIVVMVRTEKGRYSGAKFRDAFWIIIQFADICNPFSERGFKQRAELWQEFVK